MLGGTVHTVGSWLSLRGSNRSGFLLPQPGQRNNQLKKTHTYTQKKRISSIAAGSESGSLLIDLGLELVEAGPEALHLSIFKVGWRGGGQRRTLWRMVGGLLEEEEEEATYVAAGEGRPLISHVYFFLCDGVSPDQERPVKQGYNLFCGRSEWQEPPFSLSLLVIKLIRLY